MIARKNLLEDIPRFLVAQVGILFAVSLVTIQTGLQSGFTQSTSKLIEQAQADLWLADPALEHIGLTLPFSEDHLAKVKQISGVAQAEGMVLRTGIWQSLPPVKIAAVTLIGAEPQGLLYQGLIAKSGSFANLSQANSLLVDQSSLNALRLNSIGDRGKLNQTSIQLVGIATKSQTIVFDNMVFTSLKNARTYLGNSISFNYILIKAQPNQDLEQLRSRLSQISPNLKVFTPRQLINLTQTYWQERSGIGFILGLGAGVGIVVGMVVVSQILYASVADHLKQFATLKAMGASDQFLYRIILEQSLWMAILGYVPGMSLCVGLSIWTAASQGITILITPGSAIAVLGITIIMCSTSALFAIQKVMRVDPAIVFKS
ncbi:MAG: FtsX-like permease family protein [Pseudanabaenaceae cyanobacterium bins.68]|nr:FtsX-like permease family protein [Pseudanabaenaceae cyanobacterium bins.68]